MFRSNVLPVVALGSALSIATAVGSVYVAAEVEGIDIVMVASNDFGIQAGDRDGALAAVSDAFVEDALGDFDVSEAGMLERDRIVTHAVRKHDIPMVVTTAGGYGPSSWRIHFNYFRWLLGGEAGG